MAMAEHFMEQGRETLLVLDDLTRHARVYRQLSLLLRRPPGREAATWNNIWTFSAPSKQSIV